MPKQSYGYEAITVSSTAIGLTVTVYDRDSNSSNVDTEEAFITCEGVQIRYRIDGTNPTASEGHLLDVGDSIKIDGYVNLQRFKAIRTDVTDATIRVTYMREP